MSDWGDQLLRSLLFVPGSDERTLAKVGRYGADAIVVDLEDAVAADAKVGARATTAAAVGSLAAAGVVVVRVNGIESGLLDEDVAATVVDGVDAVMVPKVEAAETLHAVHARVSQAERAAGMAAGSVRLLALVETARGVARCEQILADAPPRVHTAVFGGGDFSVELGVDLTPAATEVLYARSRLVVAARAAGMAARSTGRGWTSRTTTAWRRTAGARAAWASRGA